MWQLEFKGGRGGWWFASVSFSATLKGKGSKFITGALWAVSSSSLNFLIQFQTSWHRKPELVKESQQEELLGLFGCQKGEGGGGESLKLLCILLFPSFCPPSFVITEY